MTKLKPYTIECLHVAQPELHGIKRVVVWGGKHTLNALEEKPWLTKYNPSLLNQGLLKRSLWQRFCLLHAARDEGCDLLFVPGSSYAGNFQPMVTMSQNLLPFEMVELKRYGLCFFTLKLLLLRLTQSRTFKKADGVIFETKYARDVLLRVTDKAAWGLKACYRMNGLNYVILNHGQQP